MANLINMSISSKENLGQSPQKKEASLLVKKGGDSKSSFSLSLDKALKGSEKKDLLKEKDFFSKGEKKIISLKPDLENSKLQTKKLSSSNKVEGKIDSKIAKKTQEKNNIDNIVLLESSSSQSIKSNPLLNSVLNPSDSLKVKNTEEGKVLFTSKGKSINVSIENLRKDNNSLNKNQSLRAQNSFKKEEKSFSLKPDLMIAEDLRFSSNTINSNTNSFSSNFEIIKRDSLNFPSQFWQEWESKIDAQIVDKAKIILKDGNSGEIQLKLYPEKLGTVRVSLDIEGSQVLARFILDNSQVREIFEANSSSLQKGLEESGLSVSLNFSSFGGDESQGDLEEERSNLSLALNSENEILEADLSEDVQSLIDMII